MKKLKQEQYKKLLDLEASKGAGNNSFNYAFLFLRIECERVISASVFNSISLVCLILSYCFYIGCFYLISKTLKYPLF